DRAAEDENRDAPLVELPEGAHDVDAGRLRKSKIEHDEVERSRPGSDVREQLRRRRRHDRFVARLLDRGAKPVSHERGVVGDQNRLGRDRGAGQLHIRAGLAILAIVPPSGNSKRSERVWPPARNATPKSKSTNSTSTRVTT